MVRSAIAKYLPDLVFGANDGVITTLAVVSGVVGASLSPTVILILGSANLVADGFSMGASNVLSRRSQTGPGLLPPISVASKHGFATFLGFVIAGVVPLLAYCFPLPKDFQFEIAGLFALTTLFVVGAGRAVFTQRHWLPSGLEMLVLGSLAAAIAYVIGALGAAIIRNG